MNIQIGMNCKDQVLCDQIAAAFGYLFLGLLIWFVAYLILKAIKNNK